MGHGTIRLADFLDNFREEMIEAMERAKNAPLRFKTTKIELELQITVERTAGPEGKVEFKVLGSGISIGSEGKGFDNQVHTIRLSLSPDLDSGSLGQRSFSGHAERLSAQCEPWDQKTKNLLCKRSGLAPMAAATLAVDIWLVPGGF